MKGVTFIKWMKDKNCWRKAGIDLHKVDEGQKRAAERKD
jgi:hypothetical protein